MAAVSVTDVISQLPSISVVRDRCLAMAALDAIMSPEWGDRYFSFDANWSATDQMASMRDGSGNEYSILFTPDGVWARGFDHESALTPFRSTPFALWPGLLDGLPEVFRAQASEPAFCDPTGVVLQATVCFWREREATGWVVGAPADLPTGAADDGGAAWLFDVLLSGATGYRDFAQTYYETELDCETVSDVYDLHPVSAEVVARLNPSIDLADVVDELRGMGYPVVPPEFATPPTLRQ